MLKTRFPVGRHLQQLQLSQHNAFALPLLDRAGPLYCEQILRLIPGVRASFRGRFGNRDCMVKVFFSRRRHKHDCTTELNGLAHLASAGCRIPEIIYVGPSSDQAASVLVMEWLEQADNIANKFARSDDAQKQTLLTQLSTTLARLHTAGCVQHDILQTNFLSLGDEIVCLDGEQVQHQPQPIDSKIGNDNLAKFCAQWPPRYDNLLRQAIAAYAQTRFGDAARLTGLFVDINRYRQQRVQKVFALLPAHSAALVHDDTTHCSGVILAQWHNAQWKEVLASPTQFAQLHWHETTLNVQQWPAASWWSRWRQKSAAQRQFRYAQVLNEFAIPCTTTIAWIESWQQQTPLSYALLAQHDFCDWPHWLAQHRDDGVEQLIALLQQWSALFLFAHDAEFNVQEHNNVLTVHHLDTLSHYQSPYRYRRAFHQMLLAMIKKMADHPSLQSLLAGRFVLQGWLNEIEVNRLGIVFNRSEIS